MPLLLSLLVVVVSSATIVSSGGIESFEKQWSFRNKEIILSRDVSSPEFNSSNGETRFMYAVCEERIESGTRKICELVTEYYTSDHLTYKSSCQLSLTTNQDSRIIGRNFILSPLGWSGAVFVWLERERVDWSKHVVLLRARVIDLSSCSFKQLALPIDVQDDMVDEIAFSNLVVWQDLGFDLVFHNRAGCATGWCKARFDLKTGRLTASESFMTRELSSAIALILPVNSSVASKGYFTLSWTSSLLTASLADKDAQKILGLEMHPQGYTTFGTSTHCERFGICWLPLRGEYEVHCAQMSDRAKLNFNLTLSFGYKVLAVRVHNLCEERAGFVLLQLVCTDLYCAGYKSFLVSRISEDGSHDNRPLEITGIEFDASILDRYRINFFEKSDGEFCVTVAGPASLSEFDIIQEKPRLTRTSKCFNKKYIFVN